MKADGEIKLKEKNTEPQSFQDVSVQMPYTSIEFEKTHCMEYTQLQIEEFFAQLLDVVAESTSDSRSASVEIVWGASSILRFPNWCLNGIDVGTHTLCVYTIHSRYKIHC